jgi:hypothetical protein
MNSDASHLPPAMQDDYARWQERQREAAARSPAAKAVPAFEDARAQMLAAFAGLPEKVEVPYHLTPEGERMSKFRKVLEDSPEFLQRIDRAKLPNPVAFDRVAQWDGSYPGPLAVGDTDTAKTRAAWSALGRLYVRENRAFAWFPVRRLVTELDRYENAGCADEFFRSYDYFAILFVDDADKINWQFDSQKTALFAFYDWVYRKNKPCVTTTNKGRAWWVDRMGEAFTRRLFNDAHFEVRF